MKACSNLAGGVDRHVRKRVVKTHQSTDCSLQEQAPVFHSEKRTLAVVLSHGIVMGLLAAGNLVAGMSITYPGLKNSQRVIKSGLVLLLFFYLENLDIFNDHNKNILPSGKISGWELLEKCRILSCPVIIKGFLSRGF